MDSQTSIRLIQAHGALHGDHYSFNSAEFVRWCQQEHLPMPSLEEANHELAPFCIRVGYSEPVRAWRLYLT